MQNLPQEPESVDQPEPHRNLPEQHKQHHSSEGTNFRVMFIQMWGETLRDKSWVPWIRLICTLIVIALVVVIVRIYT